MMRSSSPQRRSVGAAISGRRFSSLVLPSGQKTRAAASLARTCSIGHSGELWPSGAAFNSSQRAGSAHISPATSGARWAHGSVAGSFSSNRPNGAISEHVRGLAAGSSPVAIAAADVAGAEAWVGNELAGLRTWIDARVGQAIDYVDQRVGQAETWAAGEIGALRGYITGTLAPAIAAAAAVAATAAADLARWKKDCGDPLCNNLSTFGNEIAAIEAGLGDVAIIALLAAAVSDPQGVANEVVSLIDGPVNAVWSEVSGLLGIKAA